MALRLPISALFAFLISTSVASPTYPYDVVNAILVRPKSTPSGTGLSLSANESYILTFSSRPPAQFWSVTLYSSQNYLVPNSLERYALGCTDESITYANGSKVYPTGQHNDQYFLDGEGKEAFQMLVQPADRAPPGNWTGNWLPAPAGGVRTYGPSPALTNGSYVYSAVSKQGVIV
ncbi:hypothetical protein PRZ48_008494 [Zasmidium cellare]|uniref:DUF1214 domain-containing protein n=1 Tax=Zasmidium cellare TaxID=395010 RepID=A0ABR0EG93_ZASCE|nr:hypothetical protein PRZ48_008494 [Zasmidium cellare]